MTEKYWQKFKQQQDADPMNTNQLWVRVQQDLDRRYKQPKHYMELYSMCRSDNPFIRQIKASPNITIDTVAELICRDVGCELMYCQMMQKVQSQNSRSKLELNSCTTPYQQFTSCLLREKNRIQIKEQELKDRIMGIQLQQNIDLPQQKLQEQVVQEDDMPMKM